MSSIRILLVAMAGLSACPSLDQKAQKETDPVLRPAPGADLSGPVVPMGAASSPTRLDDARPIEPMNLGADRAIVRVLVPKLPRGSRVGFSFGDTRPGWAARIPESPQLPAVAFGGDKVYVSGGFASTSMYALNAVTGKFDWSVRTLEDNGPTAALYEDGKVIFNTESCTLFVIDAETGKRLWYKYLGDPTLAQTAVADGLVFAAHPGDGFRLSALKVKNGRRVWSRRVASELLAAPVIHGDSVYVSTVAGWSYRFIRTSGKRVWAKRLRATTAPWVFDEELFVSRRFKGKEQQVVVSAKTGEVSRVDHEVAGRYLYDVPRPNDAWMKVWAFEGSRPVIASGVRYDAMGGEIRASDPETGRPLWWRRYAEGKGRSVGTVAVAGSHVVLSTRDGKIFGLDIDTGLTLWAYDVGREVIAQPIIARGWIYTATKDGYVIALNVADASLDGWHMFGGNPQHNGPVTDRRG